MVENKLDQNRWRIMLFIIIVIFLFLIAGLVWLQIVRGEELEKIATENRLRTIPIPALRGEIYDTNGAVLVNNGTGFVINLSYITPTQNLAVIEQLAPILLPQRLIEDYNRLDETELTFDEYVEENEAFAHKRLIDNMMSLAEDNRLYRRYIPAKLAPVAGARRTVSEVTFDIVAQIEELRAQLTNVMVTVAPQRQYKADNYAFHTIGNLHAVDGHGLTGLESSYNDYLSGQSGLWFVEVNAFGRPTQTLDIKEPSPGANLHLTLDIELQKVAEDALLKSLEATRQQHAASSDPPSPNRQAHSGAVVVLDVNTGAILAMASAPQINRERYADYVIPPNTDFKQFVDRFTPLTNKVTQGARAPGSSAKPITLIAALELGLTSSSERFYCSGTYRGPQTGMNLGCWSVHGGPQDVTEGLKNSCNSVFYPLGERISQDQMSEYYVKFGIGKPIELDDLPGAYQSRIVDDAEFRRMFGHAPWPSFRARAGIGQGEVIVSPLQSAISTAMLANATWDEEVGQYVARRYKPYLVSSVVDAEGVVLKAVEPEVLEEVYFQKHAIELTREGLRKAVHSRGGTAFWQFHQSLPHLGVVPILPFEIAGKTGTTQENGWNNHGWFTSFAPYDNPQIAVVVLIEQGQAGGTTGGPIALAIYQHYFGLNEDTTEVSATGE